VIAMTVRIGYLKLGNLGISCIIDLLLDERADRDIFVRTVGTGAKMGETEAGEAGKLLEFKPQLAVVVSPNAATAGPARARETLAEVPTIVVSDGPSAKIKDELAEKGFGYIILPTDPMIGARREFLDPTEMTLFNAEVVKVLSVCGVVRLVQQELDRVINEIDAGKKPELPQLVVTPAKAARAAGFSNPYATAKARAALAMAEKVAELDVKGCFAQKKPEFYVPTVASAHELMRQAGRLADEARELEKAQDTLLRTPHAADGTVMKKTKLAEKPNRD